MTTEPVTNPADTSNLSLCDCTWASGSSSRKETPVMMPATTHSKSSWALVPRIRARQNVQETSHGHATKTGWSDNVAASAPKGSDMPLTNAAAMDLPLCCVAAYKGAAMAMPSGML